ncbi:unnamed protein product [Moneuplotes crassus]|uniref:Transmembrane protein n=1 Tax=Euplotes crassus TaxID=5936 RepID=A0AAD2CW20_EUPCR|nr:unnamed protein product [Moneuplotes crassus]
MSKDVKDLEDELLGENEYEREIRAKYDNRLYTSNYLQNKTQTKKASFGLPTFSSSNESSIQKDVLKMYLNRVCCFLLPIGVTGLSATFTYPIAVRLVKSLFKIRDFYAIHLAISPIMVFININVFGTLRGIMNVKIKEAEYEEYKQEVQQYKDQNKDHLIDHFGKTYNQIRDKYLEKEYVDTYQYNKINPLNLGKEVHTNKKYKKADFSFEYDQDRV